jgi:quercetin dioxygenase-like cupin family protein
MKSEVPTSRATADQLQERSVGEFRKTRRTSTVQRLIALGILAVMVVIPASVVAERVLAATTPATTPLGLGITSPYHIHGPTFTVDSKKATQVVTSQLTWPADSRTGWHYHPGLVFVTVTSGSLTLVAQSKARCRSTTYNAGQTFIERPRQVVNVVNSSGTPAANVVTIIGIPAGQPARVDVPAPKGCPAL